MQPKLNRIAALALSLILSAWAFAQSATQSSKTAAKKKAAVNTTEQQVEQLRQVLRLAGDGVASGEIATELGLSEGTVRNYLSEAISKLGANNRVEAARIARTRGWL